MRLLFPSRVTRPNLRIRISEAVSRDDALRTVPLDASTRWWWPWEALTPKLLDIFRRRCPRKTAGERLSPARSSVCWGLFLLPGSEGVHTLPSHHSHSMSSKMPFKSFSLRRRRRRSPRPSTSENQSQAREYYLGTGIISCSYRSWPGDATPPLQLHTSMCMMISR